MTGRLDETDYHTVREQYESDQSSLDNWTDEQETLIAVVREPRRTNIDEMCDEWWPELGMPEAALERFWARRAGYRTNSAVAEAHNKAYHDCHLDEVFETYLRESDTAQKRVSEIVSRLDDGENITLVCFEEDGKCCHRHLLTDMVESRRSSRFELSA